MKIFTNNTTIKNDYTTAWINRKIIICTLILVYFSPFKIIFGQQKFSKGTFIVITVAEDTIFVASDTKRSIIMNGETIATDTTCKIGFTNNIGFASAGLSGCESAGYDLKSACIKAANLSRTAEEAAIIIERIINIPLQKSWQILNYYEKAEVAFFQYVPGSEPIVIKKTFNYIADSIKVTTYNPVIKNGVRLYMLGFDADILTCILSIRGEIIKKQIGSYINSAYSIVEIVSQISPEFVGLPINSLICTKNGFEWKTDHQICK